MWRGPHPHDVLGLKPGLDGVVGDSGQSGRHEFVEEGISQDSGQLKNLHADAIIHITFTALVSTTTYLRSG